MTQNFFNLQIHNKPIVVRSMTGYSHLNEFINLPANGLFQQQQQFYIHKFSPYYDILLGRKILMENNGIVNYIEKATMINNRKFFHKELQLFESNSNKIFDGILQESNLTNEITYALNNEINSNRKYRLEHLNDEEKNKLTQLLKEFSDIQYSEDKDLTFTSVIRHEIKTSHDNPVYKRPYSYPFSYESEVNKQIEEMLTQGIIRESDSPYCSPLWIVPKKPDASGKKKFRLVVDYRNLNEITINDKFPIPNMDEILGKLGKCQYFTTIDLAKGFHQIEMDPKSIPKTAFSTKHGHYEYTRMPFGLKNAPATFQRCMNFVLKDLINKHCLVYLDDVIVYSTSLNEHLDSLRKVFEKLEEANLKLQLDKCEFLKKQTNFLGHTISPEGIQPNKEKVKAIEDFPIPKNSKEIKSFLGLCGYYRKFIPDFAKIAKPMTIFLKKGAKVDTNNDEYNKSFEKLKTLIMSDPILICPDFTKTFQVTTDASNFAIGAVLSQDNKPVSFASRTLNDHEQNYSTIEKELLAIVWATKYFRPFLYGVPFEILSDHKPLVWLNNIKEPNMKLQRWRIKLSEYNFKINYLEGKLNYVADALSRVKIEENMIGEIDEENISTAATIHSALESSENYIQITEKPINHFARQIEFIKDIENQVDIEKYFTKTKIKIKYTEITNSKAKEILLKYFLNHTSVIYIEDDNDFLIFQKAYQDIINPHSNVKILKSIIKLKDITSYSEFKEFIITQHVKLLHPGIEKMIRLFKETHYFPDYTKLIQNIINECETCNLAKTEHRPTNLTFELTPEINNPRELYVIDFYAIDNEQYLSCIDVYSKFASLIKTNSRDWLEAKRALTRIFNDMGKPQKIKADKDSAFMSNSLKLWLNTEEIKLDITTSKTGIADVERLHKTINEKVRIINTDQNRENKETRIETILYTYNYVFDNYI